MRGRLHDHAVPPGRMPLTDVRWGLGRFGAVRIECAFPVCPAPGVDAGGTFSVCVRWSLRPAVPPVGCCRELDASDIRSASSARGVELTAPGCGAHGAWVFSDASGGFRSTGRRPWWPVGPGGRCARPTPAR
jgi:hypothetical protein